MTFGRPPEPPQGSGPDAVWQRQLLKYIESTMMRSVVGAKLIPDARGGYHMVVPKAKSGSAGGRPSWFFGSKIELPAAPYPAYQEQQVINIQATHAIVTTGIVDAANPTGPVVMSCAGLWVATQAVPAQSTSGSTPIWNLPQFPYPAPGNMDAANNYWIYLGAMTC